MTPLDLLNNLFFGYFYTADEWLLFLFAGAFVVSLIRIFLRFLKDA